VRLRSKRHGQAPAGDIREITDIGELPTGFVAFRHLETGRLYACQPGTDAPRALKAGRHREFTQEFQPKHPDPQHRRYDERNTP
jgi:hypothetical protein